MDDAKATGIWAKGLATLVCAALILASPGAGCYQALAAEQRDNVPQPIAANDINLAPASPELPAAQAPEAALPELPQSALPASAAQPSAVQAAAAPAAAAESAAAQGAPAQPKAAPKTALQKARTLVPSAAAARQSGEQRQARERRQWDNGAAAGDAADSAAWAQAAPAEPAAALSAPEASAESEAAQPPAPARAPAGSQRALGGIALMAGAALVGWVLAAHGVLGPWLAHNAFLGATIGSAVGQLADIVLPQPKTVPGPGGKLLTAPTRLQKLGTLILTYGATALGFGLAVHGSLGALLARHAVAGLGLGSVLGSGLAKKLIPQPKEASQVEEARKEPSLSETESAAKVDEKEPSISETESAAKPAEKEPTISETRSAAAPDRNEPWISAAQPAAKAEPKPPQAPARRRKVRLKPADARDLKPADLLNAKQQAQERARRLAPDARLVSAAINLDDARAHWIFVFYSATKKRQITVYERRVAVKRWPKGRSKSVLWNPRLAAGARLEEAYAQVKARKKRFSASRVEIRAARKGGPLFVFIDAAGREEKILASALDEAAAPAASPAAEPEPTASGPSPQAAPATPAEPPAPAPAAGPPSDRAPPQAPASDQASDAKTPKPSPQVYEDFFGFRTVVGVRHDSQLKALALNSSAAQIIDQISRQFAIPREKVVALAAASGLKEDGSPVDWLTVYRRLQRDNREQFKRLDHEKYEGFRHLANRHYAPGMAGWLARAAEVHKHVVGVFVRFPFHLFDMFVLGYFRQNIAFELSHKTEDFLGDNAEHWLKIELQAHAKRGNGRLDVLFASPWGQFLEPILDCTLVPLLQFLQRRVTLALASAVVMGLLSAAAPSVGFLSISLTAVPYLGTALVWIVHGLPMATAQVPVIGSFLAPVVGAATTALLRGMVVGPLLNTLLLSAFLTVPGAVKVEQMRLQDEQLRLKDGDRLPPVSMPRALVSLLASPRQWPRLAWQVGKTFLGMATVGAEISGILTYAAQGDALLAGAYHGATGRDTLAGHHIAPLHSMASAIEGQKGQSIVPFGGAITWGNLLIYKAQNLLGFNISDHVMWEVNAKTRGVSALRVWQMAVARPLKGPAPKGPPKIGPDGKPLPADPAYRFDGDLGQKSAADIAARLKYLEKYTGDIATELKDGRAREAQMQKQLDALAAQERGLRAQSVKITPQMLAQFEQDKKKLEAARAQSYANSKLAEIHDLKANKDELPKDRLKRLEHLKQLLDQYQKSLPATGDTKAGYSDSLAVREAALKALAAALGGAGGGDGGGRLPSSPAAGAALTEDQKAKVQQVQELISKIDRLRTQAQGEMAMRDATGEMLAVVNRARNEALNERRSGKEMLAFHQNFAQLSTVMDLSLSLNEINAAEKAINGMQTVLNNKEQAINQALQQNQQNNQQAQQSQQQIQQWQNQNQQAVDGDKATQSTLAGNLTQVSQAVTGFQNYQAQTQALISQINAQDKGQSKDALTEYQRRLSLMQQWASQGGPPSTDGVPSPATLASLKTEVNNALATAQSGLAKIQSGQIPPEYFGALLVVPGGAPGTSASLPDNPNPQQVLQYLSQVRSSWQPELAQYQGYLNTVDNIINTKTITDAFGDTISLSQMQQQDTQSQAAAKQYLSQLDQLATVVNQEAHANLPMLSGLSLTQLESELPNYGTALQSVKVPSDGSTAAWQASMDLLELGQLVPYAARDTIQWAYSDAIVTQFDQALATTLPQAQQGLTQLVGMVNSILSDNQQDVNFVNGGQFNPQTFGALEARKVALLQSTIIPSLQGAQGLLTALAQYESTSNSNYDPNSKSGGYGQLYNSDIQLWNSLQTAYNQTIPWDLETFGGTYGDAAASHAAVAAFRTKFNNYLNGYTDASGNSFIGISNYITEVKERTDPNFSGTEESVPKMFQVPYLQDSNYPGGGPFSLPQKIKLYQTEMGQRAQQINAEDAQIDQILDKIKTVSGGKYDLSAYKLPVGIAADQNGVNTVTDVTNSLVQSLANQLTTIGNANSQGATTLPLPGGGTTVPTGNQGALSISAAQQVALLCKDAADRLVPTSTAQPAGAPATFAMARFLYANGVIQGVQKQLAPGGELDQAKVFLPQAQAALEQAIAATSQADAYINSNGGSLTAQQIYSGQIQEFQNLGAFLNQAAAFFNVVIGADSSASGTISQVGTYYNGLGTIYSGGVTASQADLTAISKMQQALQGEMTTLAADRSKVSSWMGQLDDPHDSALRRVSDSIDALQEKTRAVLVQNIKWHELTDQLKRSNDILGADLRRLEDQQEKLKAALSDPSTRALLDPALQAKVDSLHLGRGMWAIDEKGQAQALVVRKSKYGSFVDSILKAFAPQMSGQDLGLLRQDLLRNPSSLSQLIPAAQVVDFGDNADGFYMVYQSQFGVPNGLNTGSWVTMGNVAKIFGSNVSVTGYQFASPPESQAADGASNAPWGDKGVEVQVETLKGKHYVNYLDIDMHRFGLDIPTDPSLASQVRASRIMLFDDYAMMAMNGKLYLGVTGFGDAADSQPGDNPYYYGGNVKGSIQLTPVMSLTGQQEELFAKDPRSFLETVNLDFTGFDPSLNQTFAIAAKGDSKNYSRTQLGPSINVARLLHSQSPFTLDLYFANTSGTDDISQRSAGVSVLKGFTLRDSSGKTLAEISDQASAEKGQKYNSYVDQLSVNLPGPGIEFTGDGQILGGQKAYYGQVSKKLSDHSDLALGYGKQYVGENNRLSVMINSNFTLGQLWEAVVNNAGRDLSGGDQLKPFKTEMDAFYAQAQKSGGPDAANVAELRKVFEQDVAGKLLTQQIGSLSRDIADLRRAGALMDNMRTQGTIGFVSRGVSTDQAAEAVGGGFAAGTETDLTLTKTQKAVIDAKAARLYRDGLKLQDRLIALTQQWQQDVADIAQAEWDAKVARAMRDSAPSEAVREQAQVQLDQAVDRLDQARLRYNTLTGRDAQAQTPFDNLDASDLDALLTQIRAVVQAPDRMDAILHSLDFDKMRDQLGPNPTNLADDLKFVDQFSIGLGAQMQDLMANQIFGVGGSVRLPFYDPSSKARDKSYVCDKKAVLEEIEQAYSDQRLRADTEALQARQWQESAQRLRPGLDEAREDLSEAIREYRNGLTGPEQMRRAYDDWLWYARNEMEARMKGVTAASAAGIDRGFEKSTLKLDGSPMTISSFEGALRQAEGRWHGLHELGQREEAARQMMLADNHRIQKFWVDLQVGMNLTATGVGWLPHVNYTGIPIMPVPGLEFKPAELQALQHREDKADAAYYRALGDKVRSDLAVEFYENLAAYQAEAKAVQVFDDNVLPQLDGRQRDAAMLQRNGHVLARDQALATLNYLLGRPEGAPLQVDVSQDQARRDLAGLLAQSQPAQAEKEVLAARVEAAEAHEQIVDKGLKVTQASVEPLSLAGRTLGRLIKALSDEDAGDPDQVAAARVRTLTEQRAYDTYEADRASQAATLQARLSLVDHQIERLSNREDPESQAQLLALQGQRRSLQGGLFALGVLDASAASGAEPAYSRVPSSFQELENRLAGGEERMESRPPEALPRPTEPGVETRPATLYLRDYYARQELDRVPIRKNYVEGWLELRLKSARTPPQVLLALSKLERDKADRLYRDDQAGAAARAGILAEDFAANVQLKRWAEYQIQHPDGSHRNLAEFLRRVNERLDQDRAQIVAVLNLDPNTKAQALESLVARDPGGPRPLQTDGEQVIAGLRALGAQHIRATVLDELPRGGEDDLMSQIKADNLAERMSYKGFTPVAAFGLFRGQKIGAGFLQAPDPREVERGLSNILGDSMRKDLESSGQMQELALRLNSLMIKVGDDQKELEAERREVEAAERDYRAQMGLSQEGGGNQSLFEADAARERLVDAWLSFSRQLVRTKGDFVTLVSDLEAVDPKLINEARAPQAPRPPEGDFGDWTRDRQADLLNYWTDRMLDPRFVAAQDAALSRLGDLVAPGLKSALDASAQTFQEARRDGDAVLARDFSPEERLHLLAINDLEGKREAVRAQLAKLYGVLEQSDPTHLGCLRKDLESQLESGKLDRAQYGAAAEAVRDAYWQAVKAPYGVQGAFQRLEALDNGGKDPITGEPVTGLREARQALLDSYIQTMSDRDSKPAEFVLKDITLDEYLQREQAFDAELIHTLESPAVQKDPSLAVSLDALYDVRGALRRETDVARFGRGVLALDAMIMLEQSRLAAARWNGRPPDEIDEIAQALESLRATKQRWERQKTDLVPLYAVTAAAENGRRVWNVKGWLTQDDIEKGLADKSIREVNGVYRMADGREIVGGIDVDEKKAQDARRAASDNAVEVAADRAYAKQDAVAVQAVTAEGRTPDTRGLSLDELFFGKDSAYSRGAVFFFSAEPDAAGLHEARNPLDALQGKPGSYQMYVYLGDQPGVRRSAFPTLESALASRVQGGFYRVKLTPQGARDLLAHDQKQAVAAERRGWIGVKLNSYGFAADDDGRVVKLYETKEAFEKARLELSNAPQALADAQRELSQAQAAEAAAKSRLNALRQRSGGSNKSYEALRDEIMKELVGAFGAVEKPQKGETEQVYRQRLRAEAAQRLSGDRSLEDNDAAQLRKAGVDLSKMDAAVDEFQRTQKQAAPDAAKFDAADQAYKAARAHTFNVQGSVDDLAKKVKELRERPLNLYESDSLVLGLDAPRGEDPAVVHVYARPEFGAKVLDRNVGQGAVAARIEGPLYAAVLDQRGRLKDFYVDQDALDRAAAGWSIKTVALAGDPAAGRQLYAGPDHKTIHPTLRISHYEEGRDPVELSRRYLQERARSDASKAWRGDHYAFMPFQWVDLAMEPVRGIVDTPLEIASGRNPNEQHLIGRIYMNKGEGGETDHHGFVRRVGDIVDVLDFMPDPVERFEDLSQFPDVVRIKSGLTPGQDQSAKAMRDLSGKKDIHLGAIELRRLRRYSVEDLAAGQTETLSDFQGGVEDVWIDQLRGRAGFYEDSLRDGRAGSQAVEAALRDRTIGASDAALSGRAATFSATPGNLAVDRVERQVRVIQGAAQYQAEANGLKGYPEALQAEIQKALADNPTLASAAEAAADRLLADIKDRSSQDAATADLWNKVAAEAWKIGKERALEADIARLDDRMGGLQKEIAAWKDYLARLAAIPLPQPGPGPSPNNNQPGRDSWFQLWALTTLGLASALSALYELWRRRKAPPAA